MSESTGAVIIDAGDKVYAIPAEELERFELNEEGVAAVRDGGEGDDVSGFGQVKSYASYQIGALLPTTTYVNTRR